MEPGSAGVSASITDRKSRDEYVDIPSYVEPPAAGLATRQKLAYHGSGIAVGLLIATLAFAGWRYFDPGTTATAQNTPLPVRLASGVADTNHPAVTDTNTAVPAATGETSSPLPGTHHARANAGAEVIAAAKPASGLMYVHRNNSDLRPAPSTSSEPIKKLPKGEKVQLLRLSDKWAQVDDAGTKGWMRASVLKDTPPGEKKKKKKTDDE
ncbi:MAG TPA: SH3 domain-containing protein [Rhizomicrobium sp.]|nr:SH3 domain-containing protein [Rhizomicrobium sp.]